MKYKILLHLAKSLADEGYSADSALVEGTAEWAVLVCEAANCVAKDSPAFGAYFYPQKQQAIREAIKLGAKAWSGVDAQGRPVLFLYAKGVGAASFHQVSGVPVSGQWAPGWSELGRRDYATFSLRLPALRTFLENFTGQNGNTTGLSLEEGTDYMNSLI